VPAQRIAVGKSKHMHQTGPGYTWSGRVVGMGPNFPIWSGTPHRATLPAVDPSRPHLVEIVAALKELTARITGAADLSEAVARVLEATGHVLPAHIRCGVTVIAQGQPASFVAAGQPFEAIDEVQYADGEGPGLEAIRTRSLVMCEDLASTEQWPVWSRHARQHGVHAVLSYPFDVDGPMLGALNLYADRPTSFADETPIIAMLLAEHASVLLGVRLRQADLEDKLARVGGGNRVDASVERAIGIVMAQRGCSPERALDHLHHAASTLGVQLTDVANRLVTSVGGRNLATD
jgi:GAF domain/ANTAR domain